jgi:hypothetical protein
MHKARRYYYMIVEEQPIDEPILCWKCRELGHNMKISLIQYLDEEGHAKQQPNNCYSITKHFHIISERNDIF